MVVEALAALPRDVVLLMTARTPSPQDLATIRGKIDGLGLADRVVIQAGIADDEMPDYYRLADAVVSIPVSDSTSAAVLESLASGLQVVAADLPSVREWLFELDPALLVPADDPTSTAAALARALDRDPEERARLGREARAIVESRADEARCLAHVEALYLRLLGRATRTSS